jgi:hypothetical protein
MKKLSLAKTFVTNIRERRIPVTLKITRNCALLLNVLLRQDNILPLQSVGLQKPFSADGETMRNQIIALRVKWLEQKVIKLDKAKNEVKFPEEGEVLEVPLIQSYIGVLKKMMTYYRPIGMLPAYAEMFAELEACLDGKSLADSLDSIEEMCNEPVKLVPDKEEEPKTKTA